MGVRTIDLTGQQFDRLTVLRRAEQPSIHGVRWECQCTCGNTKIAHAYDLRHGRIRSCGCLWKETITKGNGHAARTSVLGGYKRHARNRNFVWDLTDEQFDQLTSSDCVYCGRPPSQVRVVKRGVGAFTFNGIDRVDNKQGYTIDNVVPCCGLCNRWKSDMSHDDFVSHITTIAKHLGVA